MSRNTQRSCAVRVRVRAPSAEDKIRHHLAAQSLCDSIWCPSGLCGIVVVKSATTADYTHREIMIEILSADLYGSDEEPATPAEPGRLNKN